MYDPQHRLFDTSGNINHTTMFLIFLPIFILFNNYSKLLTFLGIMIDMFKQMKGFSIDWKITASLDEALGNYWNCLSGQA